MEINNLNKYVKKFFNELELTSEEGQLTKKELLEQSILAFLGDETKDIALCIKV